MAEIAFTQFHLRDAILPNGNRRLACFNVHFYDEILMCECTLEIRRQSREVRVMFPKGLVIGHGLQDRLIAAALKAREALGAAPPDLSAPFGPEEAAAFASAQAGQEEPAPAPTPAKTERKMPGKPLVVSHRPRMLLRPVNPTDTPEAGLTRFLGGGKRHG